MTIPAYLTCRNVESAYGVNPMNIYCLSTGAVIGVIAESHVELAIAHMESTDVDDIESELYVRTCLFTRPSPAWNYMRPESLNRLRLIAPRDVLAYLMNRLYDPVVIGGRTKLTIDQRCALAASHIRLHRALVDAPFDDGKLNRLLLVMLELDAVFGLQTMQPPSSIPHITVAVNDEALIAVVDAFESWRDALILAAFKAQQSMRASDKNAPNRLASKAFVAQVVKVAPSAALQKQQAKKAAQAYFDTLFDSIVGMTAEELAAPAPEIPVTSTVKKAAGVSFGVKGA